MERVASVVEATRKTFEAYTEAQSLLDSLRTWQRLRQPPHRTP